MRRSPSTWICACLAVSLLTAGAGKVATAPPQDVTAPADGLAAAGGYRPDHASPVISGAWPLDGVARRDLSTDPGLRTAALAPSAPPETHVLVSVPRARLWMVRDGRVVGSMRVVVGRPDQPTPALKTEITHVVLNPRWHVPQDIVRERLAPEAARTAGRSLSRAGFEVMSGWADDAAPIPAGDVDWRAVADGRLEIPVRQKPGPANAMGRAKFVMPNDSGIYLHDTPDRALFAAERRTGSAGCIRVEDYEALMAFLIPNDLPPPPDADRPTYVRLGAAVPIHVTHDAAVIPGRTRPLDA
ncbi:MAG: L,D-transpeptidase family protein [Brevundimonas sp.]